MGSNVPPGSYSAQQRLADIYNFFEHEYGLRSDDTHRLMQTLLAMVDIKYEDVYWARFAAQDAPGVKELTKRVELLLRAAGNGCPDRLYERRKSSDD